MECLNCGEMTDANYCTNCGQPTSTHRFSLKHFFVHDVVHGAFHLDKGFPYSIKELLTRPGNSVREYIQGKRSKHFNYVTLLLLILGISIFLEQYTKIPIDIIVQPATPPAEELNAKQAEIINEVSNLQKQLFDFVRDNSKLVVLSLIPVYALLSFLFFRKAKQNYSEHLVLTFFKTAGYMLISISTIILRIFVTDLSTVKTIYPLLLSVAYLYSFWFIYQYFSGFSYKRVGLVLRTTVYMISEVMFQTIIGLVIAYVWLSSKGYI